MFHQKADEQSQCHEQHRKSKQRIDFSNDFVDGKHRGDDVIGENHDDPQLFRAPDALQNDGWTIDENRANHHKHKHRKQQHDALRVHSEKVADEFGQPYSAMTNREHSAQVVVDGTCEDTAENNPQIGNRTIPRSHDGTENRPRAGNVQKLNHENFPSGQRDEIHTVGLVIGRCRTVVRAENSFHESTIDEIADHQRTNGNQE